MPGAGRQLLVAGRSARRARASHFSVSAAAGAVRGRVRSSRSGLPLLSGDRAAGEATGLDQVKAVAGKARIAGLPRRDQRRVMRAHGLDHLDVAQHRLVEGDLVDAGGDLARARGHARRDASGLSLTISVSPTGLSRAERRRDRDWRRSRRPSRRCPSMETAWWMVGRQAEASTALHRQLAAAEQARAAGRDVGGGDQQLGPAVARSMREIDVRLEQLAERVEAQRIEVVGREQRSPPGASAWSG